MMTRTQILLPTEEHRQARARAAELGISLAEYVRRLVSSDLGRRSTGGSMHDLFDLGDSGGSDVANDKQRYVAEAIQTSMYDSPRVSRKLKEDPQHRR